MEENKPAEQITTETSTSSSFFSPKDNPRGFIAFLLGAFVLFAIITAFFLNMRASDEVRESEGVAQEESEFTPLAPNSVVFGYWGNNISNINALDLTTGLIHEVAVLPSSIKKVSVLSPERVIFINNTDIRDHGNEIASYDSVSKSTARLVAASASYGIDDYVISPNKRYIALWEVQIPDNQNLDTGFSRVYTVDLQNPTVKNLIYDESLTETTFASYPLAITDSGEVYMDTFKPNDNAGWANGMYVSDFTGTNKGPINSMLAGSYGTQPMLSPDGRYLAFAGYDGSLGAGTAVVGSSDGFRQAILSPNTIEMLDTATKERIRLDNLTTDNVYPDVKWDRSGKIMFSQISSEISQNGYYFYDLASSTAEKVFDTGDIAQVDTYSLISSLDNGKYLGGQVDTSPSTLGNLGQTYMRSLSEIGVFDRVEGLKPLAVNQGLIQHLDVFPASYFSNAPVIARSGDGADRRTTDQLQLQHFVIKPTLEPVRVSQQSTGRCRDVAADQCNAQMGTSYTGDEARAGSTGNDAFDACFQQAFSNRTQPCSDSPLYLYGEKGKEVSVSINTPIYGSNAPYDGSYRGVLAGDGGINISGNYYSSLAYDYTPAIRILPRLDYGKTVKAQDVDSTIRDYGKKLGLNAVEINDLVNSLVSIDSEYVFVSFFDDKVSKAILPITINPTPDVYRNVVFYLKPLEQPVVSMNPTFEAIKRRGFTAVEVSYILDK